MTFPQNLPPSVVSPEVLITENFTSIAFIGVYSNDPTLNDGLKRGYNAGRWGGLVYAGEQHTFGASVTTYVSVTRATGALNFSTSITNYNDGANFAKVETVVTGVSTVTSVTDDRAGPGGAHGSSSSSGSGTELKGLTFTSDTASQADSDPGAGKLRWNNATQGSSTVLFFDNLTLDGVSLTTLWAALGSTGFIYLQQADDSSKWQVWKWTVPPVDGTGYRKFTVTLEANGGAIGSAKTVLTTFETAGGSGTAGRHAMWIPASMMLPSATGGCAALARVASAANQPDIISLDYDPSTQEFAQFSYTMPKSWNEGTVSFTAVHSHAATTVNFGVVYDLQGVAVSDNETIAQAFGTAQKVTDTGGVTNNKYTSPESSAITIAGTPAAEDTVFFRISRATADGGDTMAIDSRLHGIILYITTDAENDA